MNTSYPKSLDAKSNFGGPGALLGATEGVGALGGPTVRGAAFMFWLRRATGFRAGAAGRAIPR